LGIVSDDDHSQTEVFLKANGVPAVAKLFNSSTTDIRKEAIWTISNITAGNQSQIQEVIDENIIPGILTIGKWRIRCKGGSRSNLGNFKFHSRNHWCWKVIFF